MSDFRVEKKILFSIFIGLTIGASSFSASIEKSPAEQYLSAVDQVHQRKLKAEPLVSLSKGSVVEMVTWTTHDYRMGSQRLTQEVWTVESQEMKAHCPEIRIDQAPELRVSQLLGMPPDPQEVHRHITVMKVPVDVYFFAPTTHALQGQIVRPCLSSGDVSARTCELPSVSAQTSNSPYSRWIARIQEETNAYPWTGLGYTYDWSEANVSHVGLSEFILPEGSNVDVERSVSIAEFCAPTGS